MPDPSWPSLSPEANYLRLVGPGASGTGTTVASAVAWQTLLAGDEAAFAQSTLNSAATAVDFEGVGGVSSLAAITGLNSSLQLLACWVQQKPPIAASAVAAYEAAVSAMIPAQVCIANRAEQAADVAANPAVLGALTPAIVALDTEYFGEHWPHNAGVGAGYGAALAALVAALAIPPPASAPGASAAASATAAAALAQTVGQTVAGEALKESGNLATSAGGGVATPSESIGQAGLMTQPLQAALGALQPVMGMFQTPMHAVQTLAGSLQPASAALRALPRGVTADEPVVTAQPQSNAGALVPEASAGAGLGNAGGGGGLTGSGVTSYSRPASSFAPEAAGWSAGPRTGLLSVAELRGAPTIGPGGGALPMSPAGSGMLTRSRGDGYRDDGPRARIVAESQPPSAMPN